MSFNFIAGNTAVSPHSASPSSAESSYLRLVSTDLIRPASRKGLLGAVGSTLLELHWLVWSIFDAILVTLAVYIGYHRTVWVPGGDWFKVGWGQTCVIQCAAFMLMGMVFGLYEQQTLFRRSRIIARSLLSMACAVTLTSLVLHLFMYEQVSRRALMLSGVIYLLFGPALRLLACWCVNSHSRKFLIVGTDRRSRLSLATVPSDLQEGDGLSERYRLVGYLAMDAVEIGRQIDGYRVLGTIDDIEHICLDYGVDEIVVGPSMAKKAFVLHRVLSCLKLGCRVTNLSTFYEQMMSEVPIAYLEPNWFLFADIKHYREAQLIMKRAFDLFGAIAGLLLSLPIWPIIALLVKLDSKGTVFYHQERVGLNGRSFKLYKFRTMHEEAEKNGHVWAAKNDPRVTRVGWYLRKTRLDELPQLWNILRGQMSIVGPRPERPEFVGELAEKIRFYNERHLIKPGLTGWAQINYRYGASVKDAQRKLQLDLWYIKHMSLELDLIILLRTMGTVFLGSR